MDWELFDEKSYELVHIFDRTHPHYGKIPGNETRGIPEPKAHAKHGQRWKKGTGVGNFFLREDTHQSQIEKGALQPVV